LDHSSGCYQDKCKVVAECDDRWLVPWLKICEELQRHNAALCKHLDEAFDRQLKSQRSAFDAAAATDATDANIKPCSKV
jgi:hypothetical protein